MDNPLAVKQREKKGAETFGKYEYQYHWALCRLLDEHKINQEYAIFVELHEDVVLANSLDVGQAKFEFSQIKCVGKEYKISDLIYVPPTGKNSILGKLISSGFDKAFKDSISTINLAASSGYNKEIIADGLELEVITVADMSKTAVNSFSEKLKAELGLEGLPENLRFIIPELPNTGHQNFVLGKISKLITSLYPKSLCGSEDIYRLLMEELRAKGTVQYDYKEWDDLLKKKALTSKTVQKVVNENTSIKGLEEIDSSFNLLVTELGLHFMSAGRLRREITNYYTNHVAQPSALQIRLSKIVRDACESMPEANSPDLITHLESIMDDGIKRSIGNDLNLKASIIYELIQVMNG